MAASVTSAQELGHLHLPGGVSLGLHQEARSLQYTPVDGDRAL